MCVYVSRTEIALAQSVSNSFLISLRKDHHRNENQCLCEVDEMLVLES